MRDDAEGLQFTMIGLHSLCCVDFVVGNGAEKFHKRELMLCGIYLATIERNTRTVSLGIGYKTVGIVGSASSPP